MDADLDGPSLTQGSDSTAASAVLLGVAPPEVGVRAGGAVFSTVPRFAQGGTGVVSWNYPRSFGSGSTGCAVTEARATHEPGAVSISAGLRSDQPRGLRHAMLWVCSMLSAPGLSASWQLSGDGPGPLSGVVRWPLTP